MTKLQKVGVRAWREKQNQVLHSHQNQGENKRQFKTRLLTYKRIIMICFTYFNAVKFPYCLTATCGITTELWQHNPHKRLSCLSSCTGTLLQQKPLPRVSFCRLQCSFVVAEYFRFCSTNIFQSFHACPWTTRKRKCPALGAIFIAKFHQRNQPH